MTYVTCTRHPEGCESGIIATMEVEALWKWKHDGSGSTMEVVSGSGKWKYCVDGPNEPPYVPTHVTYVTCTRHPEGVKVEL